jgi:hypothetical protein
MRLNIKRPAPQSSTDVMSKVGEGTGVLVGAGVGVGSCVAGSAVGLMTAGVVSMGGGATSVFEPLQADNIIAAKRDKAGKITR